MKDQRRSARKIGNKIYELQKRRNHYKDLGNDAMVTQINTVVDTLFWVMYNDFNECWVDKYMEEL